MTWVRRRAADDSAAPMSRSAAAPIASGAVAPGPRREAG
uniref:Uncharacterized protein n=1 Tax=Arthrobacter sp. JBH1 TaxID=723551 RepID=I1Y9H7_9MICC|nr:hypothetical protein [Arthrobacter sp. JBH1]